MYCVLVDRFPQLLLYTWGRHYNYDGDDGDDDEMIMIDDDDKACSYVSWYVWYILIIL